MKIKDIKINHYGNLENKEFHLGNNINIIYGKNESGKSTLLNYIKSIFYGISKNKNGKEISDYERYKPWMKEEFSGKLSYELDNGEGFEVFRDFHKKNPKIFNYDLEDVSKEFSIDKKEGMQFLFEQTRVDEKMFLSTIMSMQQEVRLDKQSQQILVQKIANLAGTGDDNVSFKRVIDRLNKKQVDEIGTERTQEKPINIAKDKLRNITNSIEQLEAYQRDKIQLEMKKKQLEEKVSELEIQNEIMKRLNETSSEIDLQKEKIHLKNTIKDDIKEKIDKLMIEKNDLLENKRKIHTVGQKDDSENRVNSKKGKRAKGESKAKYLILFIVVIVLAIGTFLSNQFYIKNPYLNIFSFAIIPIYLVYVFIRIKIEKRKKEKLKYEEQISVQIEEERLKNERNIIDTKIEYIDKQIEQLTEENTKQLQEMQNMQIDLDTKIDDTIQKIKCDYEEECNVDELLDNLDFSSVQSQLTHIQNELNQNKLLLHSAILEEENIAQKLENIIRLKEEYRTIEEELSDLEEKNHCISLVKEYLNKAYEKMKREVTPKFTDNLSKNIASISNEKYTKVNVHDDNGIMVENEFGEYIPADRLSVGTIDQLYLALRLSMINEISEEFMPIILDEAFAYYDETRLENILEFLINKLGRHQLIIFTCTHRERDILNKLQVSYNLVELS